MLPGGGWEVMTAPNTSEEQPPSPGHWGTSSDLGQVNDIRAGFCCCFVFEDIHLAAGNKWSEIVRRRLQRTGPEIEIQAKLSWELGSRVSTTGSGKEEEGVRATLRVQPRAQGQVWGEMNSG